MNNESFDTDYVLPDWLKELADERARDKRSPAEKAAHKAEMERRYNEMVDQINERLREMFIAEEHGYRF
jgi:hypothetical protein